MRDFSQLLDALVYTRSRTAKLKLIGDYLKRTPDPDRGYALAALTGELNLPAVKPAAIRAIVEERVDPVLLLHEPRLCRRPGRDRVAALAEAGRPAGRSRRRHPAPRQRGRAAGDASAGPRRRARWRRMLDHLDASGRFALLKLATGALRIGVSARLAKVALAQAFALDVDAVEEVWHGIGPPYLPLFAWAEGRGAQPTAENVPVFRPFMLAHPLEDCASRWTIMPPSGNGTASASSSSAPAARPGSTAAPATTSPAASPTSPRPSRAEGVLDGELLVRGEAQGGEARQLQRSPAAARPQDRLGADAGRLSRLRPALRHPVRRRGGSARAAAGPSGARGSKRFVPPARSRALRPLRPDRGRQTSRRSRRSAPAPATPRSRA